MEKFIENFFRQPRESTRKDFDQTRVKNIIKKTIRRLDYQNQ